MFRTLILVMAMLAAPATAAQPRPGALSRLDPGAWLVTSRDGGPSGRICLGDPHQLLQRQHADARGCSRFVIADDADATTVHYTCGAAGHGRTQVRVETPRLVQIASSGIANGAPFDWRAQARFAGACR